ncbi:MAG: TRAP transporter large permease subunit [Myxococcales bacterium]|nr:TRAP transporter large permease subunit [Myxococcales bacterium]
MSPTDPPEPAPRASSWRGGLRRLDKAWLKLERAGVVAGFLVMSAVVFADVFHRVSADRAWQTPLKLLAVGLAGWGLCWAAVRTATKSAMPHRKAAGLAALLLAGVALAAAAFVWLVPAGVIWAQTFALVLTIWVGFLGASIATAEGKHLKVDAAERLFKGAAKHWVGTAANLFGAGFSLALAVLAFSFCRYHYGVWQETEGAGGAFEGLPIPKFLAFAILPLALGTMTLRFFAAAYLRAHGEAPPEGGESPAAAAPPAGERARPTAIASRLATPLLLLIAVVLLWRFAFLGPEAGGTVAVLSILAALIALVVLGAPLFVVLGMVATLCFLLVAEGYDTFDSYQVFVVKIANLSTKNVLLAIPFFVVSGAIMSAGSIAARLIALARALVGWLPGGLAVATIFACVFFAAISGSSPVTVIAIGSLMLPALLKEGYREKFSLGLLTAAGSLGIVIPPSIPMLVYALVASNTSPVDVGEMFLAGVVPGFFLAALMAVHAVWTGVKEKRPTTPFSPREAWGAFREGFWALGLPAVIMGGIYSGLFTPTEAAAVSVAYALVVELLVHRQLKLAELFRTLRESGVAMGALLMIMALSFGLNDFLVEQRVPDEAAAWIASKRMTPVQFVLAVNLLLLLVGCLMDSISALLILGPLLVPIAYALGLDLVHVGIVFIVNLEIGYLTPPVGMNLFVASTVFQKPLGTVIRGALPYIGILATGLLVLAYVPTMSLGPVNLFLRKAPVWAAFPSGPAPKKAEPSPEEPKEKPGKVLSMQEMMGEARKKREASGEADAGAGPGGGKVMSLQQMMEEARRRREAKENAQTAP